MEAFSGEQYTWKYEAQNTRSPTPMSRMTLELMPAFKINWLLPLPGTKILWLYFYHTYKAISGKIWLLTQFFCAFTLLLLARAITKEKDHNRKIAESVVLLKDVTLWIFRSFSPFQLWKENGRWGTQRILHPSKASLHVGQECWTGTVLSLRWARNKDRRAGSMPAPPHTRQVWTSSRRERCTRYFNHQEEWMR